MRVCHICETNLDLLGKNKKAKYCSIKCRNKSRDRDLLKLGWEKYYQSIHGKAVTLYHNSKTRNSDNHTITVDWIEEKLEFGFCEVTNLPFEFVSQSAFCPSLDRIDSSLGYTKENTRVVVWIYNCSKNSFSDEDVLKMAHALMQTAR